MFATTAFNLFEKCVEDYHEKDDIYHPINNPFSISSIEYLLYEKCWIDVVQWHLEDIIRDPNIQPEYALKIKRSIDASNQKRTDMVEQIDDFFVAQYQNITPHKNAGINTESPAWAIDRLSILAIKIYHMKIEATRENADNVHLKLCGEKLHILEEQKKDLILSIHQLLQDIEQGLKYMKVYKQMKMYNDITLNPVLYKKS